MTEIPEILIDKLAAASNIAILTGAGVSAESGIKTFRDPDGLWAKFNPAELASMNGFLANPELVWEWYAMRVDVIKNAEPNPGHFAIAELEKMYQNFTLITQNVDRLHQRAGSQTVLELHGNIVENHCSKCHRPFKGETALPDMQLPKCPDCGGNIRPSVVWFGENLPVKALNGAEHAAKKSDVFFTIGTSGEVYPAAQLPLIAKNSGAFVVEINPNKTSLTPYLSLHLSGTSGELMPVIIELLKDRKGTNYGLWNRN